MMIPLAYSFDGDPFDPPAEATGWRIKRLRVGRGAPELVYGDDGTPLIIPLESGIEDLRRAVQTPGRYRLDPVDDACRVIKPSEAAYIWVSANHSDAAEPMAVSQGPTSNAVVIEGMRQNAALARALVDRFPAMLEASAVLLSAAHDAGITERGRPIDANEREHRDEVPRPGLDVGAIVAQLVPALLKSWEDKLSGFASKLGGRREGASSALPTTTPASIGRNEKVA